MVVIGSPPNLKPDKQQPSREWLHSPNILASIEYATAKLVFLYVANRFLAGEEIVPWTVSVAAREIGCSERAVYEAVRWLISKGFVQRARRYPGKGLTIPTATPELVAVSCL